MWRIYKTHLLVLIGVAFTDIFFTNNKKIAPHLLHFAGFNDVYWTNLIPSKDILKYTLIATTHQEGLVCTSAIADG